MKKLIALFFTFHLSLLTSFAQNECENFRAYLFNKEYQLFIRIDLCNEAITIPGQELYGQLPGYIGRKNNSFCWIITSAEIKNRNAHLSMINDYGSEDFTATLSQKTIPSMFFSTMTVARLKCHITENGRNYLKSWSLSVPLIKVNHHTNYDKCNNSNNM